MRPSFPTFVSLEEAAWLWSAWESACQKLFLICLALTTYSDVLSTRHYLRHELCLVVHHFSLSLWQKLPETSSSFSADAELSQELNIQLQNLKWEDSARWMKSYWSKGAYRPIVKQSLVRFYLSVYGTAGTHSRTSIFHSIYLGYYTESVFWPHNLERISDLSNSCKTNPRLIGSLGDQPQLAVQEVWIVAVPFIHELLTFLVYRLNICKFTSTVRVEIEFRTN